MTNTKCIEGKKERREKGNRKTQRNVTHLPIPETETELYCENATKTV